MQSDEVLKTLQRIESHLESLVRMQLATAVKTVFADDIERQAFDMTGIKSSAQPTVSTLMTPLLEE